LIRQAFISFSSAPLSATTLRTGSTLRLLVLFSFAAALAPAALSRAALASAGSGLIAALAFLARMLTAATSLIISGRSVTGCVGSLAAATL
jgi:hypothetical protein